MDIKQKILQFKSDFDPYLEFFLKSERNRGAIYSPHISELIENLSEFSLRGGKRLRPSFAYFSYLAHGGEEKEEMMKAAVFIELIQTYLLIHDDIIDQAELRRGKPSFHKLYQTNANKSLGSSMAILAGDIVNHLATLAVLRSNFPDHIKIGALETIQTKLIEVGYGQFLELIPVDSVNLADIYKIYALKTARYTVEIPLILGASLAGASAEECRELEKIAVPAGVAFQIQDDILGLFNQESETGKSSKSDIEEGKKTSLIVRTLELADETEKEFLLEHLGKANLREEDFERIKSIIKNCGALSKEKEEAERLIHLSQKKLDENQTLQGEGREFIKDTLQYLSTRQI